jgi:Septum formation
MSGRRADERPERERYQTASWTERIGDELRAMRAHPGVILVALLVIGGGVVLNVLRPQVVQVRGLAVGDCLDIRAADADRDGLAGARRIGSAQAAVDVLYAQGAERAGCDQSHSHEVISTDEFAEQAIAPYPGASVLQDRLRAGCVADFATYVGHPLEDSELDLVVAVPDEAAWNAPIRVGVCLVARRDGDFLAAPARGSGR